MALFLRPTGLAVGLALKEMRYAVPHGDSPQVKPLWPDPWIPRVRLSKTGLRLIDGADASTGNGRKVPPEGWKMRRFSADFAERARAQGARPPSGPRPWP